MIRIPKGTKLYKSDVGHYRFYYPSGEAFVLLADISTDNRPSWLTQKGKVALALSPEIAKQYDLGSLFVWIEKDSYDELVQHYS